MMKDEPKILLVQEVRMTIRNREEAQGVLRQVADEKRFFVHDGKILSTILELKTELGKMAKATYSHHVNEEKNDVARWVREVLGDDKLARDLTKAATQKEARQIVARRISWLEARA
jgi:hypothetical protein